MAILGIDEVGRGPLAGPLVVGAVILPEPWPEWVGSLRDSKKLSAKKREELSGVILAEAPAAEQGWGSPVEIDELGMSEALKLATRRAVEEVRGYKASFSQVVIDGKVNFLAETSFSDYVSTVVKADDSIKEVSAASIVAKVARDKYMAEVALRFPGYGFEKHVGYGTKMHLEAISRLGICPEHRRSFEPIRTMVGFTRSGSEAGAGVDGTVSSVVENTTSVGRRGEEAVCGYLEGLGHKIVARNFKTYFYEIDIVSVNDGEIYFTEVKTRASEGFGGGLAAIDKDKLRRMRFAAECFLKYRRRYSELDPLLAVAAVDGDFRMRDWFSLGVDEC